MKGLERKAAKLAAAALACLLLAACSAGGDSSRPAAAALPPGLAGQLPALPGAALPDLLPVIRRGLAADFDPSVIASAGSMTVGAQGSLLSFSNSAGMLSYALLKFSVEASQPLQLNVDFGNLSGSTAGKLFIGVSNYGDGVWDFVALDGAGSFSYPAGNFNSPAGDTYVLFALFGALNGSADTITLTSDAVLPSEPGIYGAISSPGGPVSAVTVYLIEVGAFGNISNTTSSVTGPDGRYAFPGLGAAQYRVSPQKGLCGFTPPLPVVPYDGSAIVTQNFTAQVFTAVPANVNYTAHMRPLLFASVCMNCHDSGKTFTERNGAPADVNWNTYGGTTLSKKTLGNSLVHSDEMPPSTLGFKTTQFQKDLFQAWASGGFPEN